MSIAPIIDNVHSLCNIMAIITTSGWLCEIVISQFPFIKSVSPSKILSLTDFVSVSKQDINLLTSYDIIEWRPTSY